MKKGDKARGILGVWGLIVVLIVVVSCFSWAAGSEEEAGAYKVGAYSEQDGSLFNTTELCSVTLITGDVVIVTILPDGKRGFAIKSADPTKLGQSFQIFKIPKGTYIFPEEIDLSKVDKELFNIDYLIREEYCNLTYLPILVDYKDKEEKVFGVAEQKELEKEVNITIVKSYHSIPTFSAKLSFEGINETFKTLVERPEIKKIWLDKKVKVSLYESVPLIGAPELWESGYKGSGLEIAILDTGIDDTHPDLDDLDDNPATYDPKVISKVDFTDDDTTEDLYGHGTHCAGIAAGTGAAPSEHYPTPTPVPTPTVTPTPPSSSEVKSFNKVPKNPIVGEDTNAKKDLRDTHESEIDGIEIRNISVSTIKSHSGGIPITGGNRTVVTETYSTPIYSKIRIQMDDTEDNDLIQYKYDFNLTTNGFNYTLSGTSTPTKEDINETLSYDIDSNGENDLFRSINIRVYTSDNDTLDVMVKAWNGTAWKLLYGIIPPAEFNDVYSDYGEDTDGDGLNNSLVIEVGVNVTKAGRYRVRGELYENETYHYIISAYNTTYLDTGNHSVLLKFDGLRLRQNKYNGTYDLKYLRLYNAAYPWIIPIPISEYELKEKMERGEISSENVSVLYGEQFDYRYYAYTTNHYSWTEFQKPPAEFTGNFNDYGEDTDGDVLYDFLVIEVGVNVTKAGRYEVSGDLYENGTYNWVDWDSNTTHLSEGNQTVQLRFEGIKIRQNKYNGTYDLKHLGLYNASYPWIIPIPISEKGLEEEIESGEISPENVSAMYGEQLDYRYYAYTTSPYNWTEFQRPPAEFNDVYSGYGEDTDGDGLNNSLVIEVGVNVTKAGRYRVRGELYENETYHYIISAYNTTYLDTGNHSVLLKFDGLRLRQNKYNGTYDLRYLGLYNYTYPYPYATIDPEIKGSVIEKSVDVLYGERLDYRYYAYTTGYYEWTGWQKPPAEFNDVYSDYGEDTDGDGLNNSLVIEVGVNVTKAGRYRVRGDLYENATWHYIISAYNTTYLGTGNHSVLLKFDGIRLRQNKYNGTYDLRYLYLYNMTYPYPYAMDLEEKIARGEISPENVSVLYGEQLDYRYYAYTTSPYNWTEFQRPPAEFNDVYSDYGEDTNEDALYDFLVIEVGMNVTKAGRYRVWGELYENGTYHWVDYATKSTYLCEGNQTIKLKFSGIEIRENSYNGTYDLKHLGLYSEWKEDGYTYWKRFDYRYYAYTTDYYNYTDFQEFPRYIGVAPGAYLWNVKVLNQYGRGYESWIIDGIEYAAYGPDETANTGDEADIISMSLGGAPTDGTDPLSQAVNEAVDQGLVVAVAAGNNYDYFTVSTPGAAEKVITVGASDKEDDLAYFSSKGPTLDLRVKPDIVAPGVDIIAPRASGTSMGYPYNDYYMEASGTSMATPHVAGAAALILQVHPDWTPEEVKNVLISTAEDLGYNVYQQGGGRIYVPSAANPKILVNPATISFKNLDTTSETITFKNLDTVTHTLTLDVAVREVFNDTQVDCAYLNRTSLNIAPGSSASVLLTVNGTSLPHSLYSGKVSATYSGGEVHSIFGFSNLNKVTVDKKNMSGMPAVDEFVVIFSDVEDAWEKLMIHDGITDENGTVTFYLPDGTYNIISVSGWQIAIICAVEEVVYKGNVTKPEETLNSLREFRDRALKDKYVALYYEYSPDIRRVLIEEPGLLLEAAKLITKYRPAVKYVLGEESGKDLQMDKKEVEEITSFTNKLKDAIKERETQIGAERSSEIIKSIEELKEQIKFSEGEMFSRALEDSIYSQNNIVVNEKVGKEAATKEQPTDASVYTIKENLTIESDVNITLDERDTYVIDFDYNKTGQIMSEKFDEVYYWGNVSVMFASHRSYPDETETYITPTNSFKSIFIYSYYPEEYYNESNFSLINAPEWHKLLYNLSSVTENVTFVANYEKLVERSTDYKVALKPELASWYYHTWHPDMWLSITSIYEMNAPLHRIEWLSPSPVSYTGGYEQYAEWWNETYPGWLYDMSERCYPAGSKLYFAAGEHPFKSGAKIDILWKGILDIYGTISEDTFGNSFANESRCNITEFDTFTIWNPGVSGNLTVIKDGEVVIDHIDIWDYFYNSTYFEGTPNFKVIIQGNSSPRLSTYTRTELNFIADLTKDYQPPMVTMRALGSDLNNTVLGGDVKVKMNIEDESNISDATLEYSLDNGTTWSSASITYKGVSGCKPISGGDRTVVDETYATPIHSKVRIFMDDTEDNDEIFYNYIFTLKKSDSTEYTKSRTSQSTFGDINDTLYYDEDSDGILDLLKSIYIGAYTEDDDTLDVKVAGWNGATWGCLYGKKIRRYEADLGYMNNTFVSLRANATDSEGNSMSQTVIKGFYVSGLELIKVFDTGPGTYPSIFGTHNGTITPNQTINISKLYTYPCPGTGGHTKSFELYENGIPIANGTWNGYVSDWHNLTIHNVTTGAPYIMLLKDHKYNYTIITGSYPQIIHAKSKDAIAGAGTITCDKFIDANGKEYTDWIPAIKLFL